MIYIGCIADDFTGAGDAASFLRRGGLKTVYISGAQLGAFVPAEDVGAIVIALKCRSIPAPAAVEQACAACRWLLERGARHIYYKYCSTFDSTAQGNIGPVTDALLELLDAPYTILCPALPVNGRTVKDGILYVDGVPLAESPMKDHPLNPMLQSYLPSLMEMQSAYPCVSLSRAELYGDGETLSARLRAKGTQGKFTAAVDYTENCDGERLAAHFAKLPLLTGGSGLLEHLGRYYAAQAGEARDSLPAFDRGGRGRLLLAGSCSAMTSKQVARYLAAGKQACKVRPLALLDGSQTQEQLRRLLAEAEEDILFYSTDDPAHIRENQRHGAERVSELLESTMGALACAGVALGYTRLVVAGGETSGRVMLSLGYAAYEIFESLAPGVPRMTPVEAPELNLVLKSGNFGNEDFLLTALC